MVTMMEKTSQELVAAMNSHDVEKIASFYTDDCLYECLGSGQTAHGKSELKKSIKEIFTAMPDVKLEVKSMVRSGDWAASEWIMSGTHSGSMAGIPATGKKFSFRGANIQEYRNDKIKRETDYWNMMTFLQQVGLAPSAPPK